MKTYPAEFRHRVIALTDDGMTTSEIAEVLGTSATWVRSIKALHKAGKPLEPKSRANKRTSLAEREGKRLRAQIAAKLENAFSQSLDWITRTDTLHYFQHAGYGRSTE